MADQVFPYHLAGFAMGALATGYSISSLKQYLTRPVTATEEIPVDPNIPLLNQTRKRKRDSDGISLPPTKRRLSDAVNTSLSTSRCIPSDDMSAPSPIKSVKVTSNSEQDSMEVTIGNVSSSPARCVQRNSHYDVKISFHERKHHTDSYATIPPRNKKVGTDAEVSTAETEANEEDYHSDRTIIGDDLEHHDDGSEDESEKANRSADHDEEHRDLSGLIGEEPGSETHKEADNDFVDHAEKEPRSREDDEDDDGAENDSQDDSGAHKEAIQIDIYRQKKVDLKISILKERSNGLELMVQSRQPKARMMRRRRQGKLQCWGVVLQVCT